jgi:hypothetical protein
LREANAAGQIWTDPRSGEIINGEVLWWNDVVSLIKMWRFTQTASVDPEARSLNYSDHFMGEMVRYAIAHEVGHMLGLQHNMRSSYGYESDSLRSPSFTQKYGTTASIMDYARNNHIALPGDLEKGVTLTPPHLGPFDYLSIGYGYKFIHGNNTPEQEYQVLDSLLESKQDNPFYMFAPFTASPIVPDPSAQSYSLGNDIVKSSFNGIYNTRIIVDSLVNWTVDAGGSIEDIKLRYDALVKQYFRYITLPLSYLGGEYETQGPLKSVKRKHNPVTTEKQREALEFVIDNLQSAPQYFDKKDLFQILGSSRVRILDEQKDVISHLLGGFVLPRIMERNIEEYDIEEYLGHLDALIWNKADGDSLYDKNLRISYINALKELVSKAGNKNPSVSDALVGEAAYLQLMKIKTFLSSTTDFTDENKLHYNYLLKIIEE